VRAGKSGEALRREDIMAWHRLLVARGWMQTVIFTEELAHAATVPILPFGINMVAPVIQTFGTAEQKQRFLPPPLRGEVWWCQCATASITS
jgi:alkylation response protein AidB-like acyl-CoA dehydrogenase